MQRFPRARLTLLAACTAVLAGCDLSPEPPAAPGAPPTRTQLWPVCQDVNRGMASVEACTTLLESGEETRQRQGYLHYNRGLSLSRRGRTQEAIADFDAALAIDPGFALALYQRGLAYQGLGQQIRAEQDLRLARQINPRLP